LPALAIRTKHIAVPISFASRERDDPKLPAVIIFVNAIRPVASMMLIRKSPTVSAGIPDSATAALILL